MSWKPLGSVLPESLGAARTELHWAIQLVSAAGTSLLERAPDFSHTNLAWDKSLGVLAGRPVGHSGLRAALVFEGLELAVLDGAREVATLALAGRTLDDGLRWLGAALGADSALQLPEHDMPDHPVQDGIPFSEAETDGRRELAAWYADATQLIEALVQHDEVASPVRCWPHHFDVATLLTFDPDKSAEDARSIGIGFSPGDGRYASPYFYVTPWPYPDASVLPELDGTTCWNTEEWTGAVLASDALISVSHEGQHAFASGALQNALDVSRALLGV